MNDKDIYFKNKFDTTKFEDDIYTQLAKNMAKAVDIDFAKTPVIDILTGYINYIELQSNWNSLREWLKKDDNVYICYSSQKSNKTFEAGVRFGLTFALDKMNELESGEK